MLLLHSFGICFPVDLVKLLFLDDNWLLAFHIHTISRSWLWLNLALRLIISTFALWIANVNLLLRKRKWLRIHIIKSFFVVQQTYFHMSISPTFYEQLFCTKVFRAAAFLYLNCWFILFWRKEIGAKTAYTMLVKLTPWFTHRKLN